MKVRRSTVVWSEDGRICLRKSKHSDEVDIRVHNGWQFIDLKELKRMVKRLEHEARTCT